MTIFVNLGASQFLSFGSLSYLETDENGLMMHSNEGGVTKIDRISAAIRSNVRET